METRKKTQKKTEEHDEQVELFNTWFITVNLYTLLTTAACMAAYVFAHRNETSPLNKYSSPILLYFHYMRKLLAVSLRFHSI